MVKKLCCFLLAMIMCVIYAGCGDNSEKPKESPSTEKEINMPDKFVTFSLWDWMISTSGDAAAMIKVIKNMGYNAVDFTFRWQTLEYTKGEYSFRYIDSIMDEIIKADMYISTSLMYWTIGIPWADEIELQKTSDGNVYEFSGRGASPSFSDEETVNVMVNAFKAFASHISDKYGDKVFRIHARTSQYGELEYFCDVGDGKILDYGEPAINAFKKYLKNKFVTPEAIDAAYGTNVSDWDSLDEIEPKQLSDMFYFDWQTFRQREVLNLSSKFDKALEKINPDIPFALQVGCYWDAAATYARGLIDPYLASKVCDIIHTDDGPNFPHNFSIDYVSVSDKVEYASEIDGYSHPTIQQMIALGDKSLSPYIVQAEKMGEAGIKYLNTANWSYSQVLEYEDTLAQYPIAFYNATPRADYDPEKVILINTADILYKKTIMTTFLMEDYNLLSGSNGRKVRFVTDTQLLENPELLAGITDIYLGKTTGNCYMRQDFVNLLKTSSVKIHTYEKKEKVTFLNEYGKNISSEDSAALKNKI